MIPHDDITAESVAEVWHQIAKVISIAAAVSGIGIAVTAGIGAAWHQWAAKQHTDRIAELRGKQVEIDR